MGIRKFFLVLTIMLISACSTSKSLPDVQPQSGTTPAPQASSKASSSSSTSTVSSTQPAQPTLPPPPSIDPQALVDAKVLQEYWPVIREAAGIPEKIDFGTSMTDWEYSQDGRYLAVAGCDGQVASGYVYELQYIANCEQTLQETVAHAYLFILDAQTANIIATLPETGQVITVSGLRFTPDGEQLIYNADVVLDADPGRTIVWDIASGQSMDLIPKELLSDQKSSMELWMISPDHRWMVLNQGLSTKVWDVAQAKVVFEKTIFGDVLFSADGQKLLVEDYPYLVIYDTNSWQELSRRILVPDGLDNIYTYSPDLTMMATCDNRLTDKPRTMKIWDTASGVLIQELKFRLSRCARLSFSPDSRLLIRFDDHGGGPIMWNVDGWKFVRESDVQTTFVGSGDLYVNSLQFAQDGRTLVVDTEQRLTLYELPQTAEAAAPMTAAATTTPPSVPPLAFKPPSCTIVVQGYVEYNFQECDPLSTNAGRVFELTQDIVISSPSTLPLDDPDYIPPPIVTLNIPIYLQDILKPGKYLIGDATEPESNFTADFTYFLPPPASGYRFDSYGGGELILTQAGLKEDYISGSFKFGAHSDEGFQVTVEGSFENVPFSHVNGPD